MSTGLLIKDENDRVILDPSTFTTRYVTSFIIPAGTWGTVRRFSVTLAKSGMFAAACALGGYQTVFGHYGGWYAYQGERFALSLPRMPALRVGDGWVEAYPPGGSRTRWSGNIQVLVFTSV